jgi:hypothetical protein
MRVVAAGARYFKLMETPPHVTASPLVARNQKPDKKGTLTSCAAALPARAVLDSRPGPGWRQMTTALSVSAATVRRVYEQGAPKHSDKGWEHRRNQTSAGA